MSESDYRSDKHQFVNGKPINSKNGELDFIYPVLVIIFSPLWNKIFLRIVSHEENIFPDFKFLNIIYYYVSIVCEQA